MTTMMTARQRWLAALLPFVRAHLPAAPGRVLEIGCGPAGGFVPALTDLGYRAVGVDPAAPSGPGYHQIEFERLPATDPVDAVVACTSLHHVADLDEVLDLAAARLAPGGVIIVVEWAHEKFDEATARWCFDRLPDPDPGPDSDSDSEEPGWLRHHRDQWLASGRPWHAYIGDWVASEHLHSGEAIVAALRARFGTRLLTSGPYFFADLHPAASMDDEQEAIDAGRIQATGIRFAGDAPRDGAA
ncbi:MAG TPA: methyltransferase domain-containing protein [Streptosporangiaceae bacterium]